MEWLGYLGIGALVGFFAGLLGIGGGAIMVPLLVWLFEVIGLPKSQLVHLGVGTSMATILFTSLSSMRAHAARGALRWDIARAITPGILAGGLAGAALAGFLSSFVFAACFTAFVYAAATNLLIDKKPPAVRQLPGLPGMFAAGFFISGFSALAAIGGAVMTIPFMLYCNVPLIQAIGTAAIIGFPIAVSGSIGFALSGLGQADLPAWSLGYVYLPALAGISITSVLLAPLGAALAHRMPTRRLKQVFAGLLFVLATHMLVRLA